MEQCHKIRDLKSLPNLENCLRYTELLKLKCPSKSALQFSKKKFCKFDITQEFSGPKNYKLLKVNSNKSNKIFQGWCLNQPFLTNHHNSSYRVLKEENQKWIDDYLQFHHFQTQDKKKNFQEKMQQIGEHLA